MKYIITEEQNTLEEVAQKIFPVNFIDYDKNNGLKQEGFITGAKWQQEQYTTEEQYVGHSIGNLEKEYIKGFNEGSKWQSEKMYSEEDMKSFADWCRNGLLNTEYSFYKLNEHLQHWKELTNYIKR